MDTMHPAAKKMTLTRISNMTEDEARAYIEQIVWPNGPVCPHCESERVGTIKANPEKNVRAGLYKCKNRECRKQFTVSVGTVMERSHIDMKTWLSAFQLLCASKKGISALQMQRLLGLSYKTAWFLCHRIRHALANGFRAKFTGTVEVDETYVGGKPRYKGESKRGRGTNKIPVVGLVERGGDVRTRVIANITGKTLKGFVRDHAMPTARIISDELASYNGLGDEFAAHETVNHSAGEYVRPNSDVHSNTVESFWSLVKRSLMGAWHHVSPEHIPRYMSEREFTWNTRKLTDGERTAVAISRIQGARLTYKRAE